MQFMYNAVCIRIYEANNQGFIYPTLLTLISFYPSIHVSLYPHLFYLSLSLSLTFSLSLSIYIYIYIYILDLCVCVCVCVCVLRIHVDIVFRGHVSLVLVTMVESRKTSIIPFLAVQNSKASWVHR